MVEKQKELMTTSICRYKRIFIRMLATALCAVTLMLGGCSKEETDEVQVQEDVALEIEETAPTQDTTATEVAADDTANAEQGKSLDVDVAALQQKNPDIFAWLTVPGTDIDMPVLRSEEDDTFYTNHDADKALNSDGAAYAEMATMPDMCDFNTVIHGSKTLFGDLIQYENPDFFEKNDTFYIYLPDNVLTYTVWAVYRRENNSLLRSYDFGEGRGCREYLQDVYEGRYVGKQIREGWFELDEYKFLTTLTIDEPEADNQLVVVGALSNDAAGTIDRTVIEQLDLGPNLLEQ